MFPKKKSYQDKNLRFATDLIRVLKKKRDFEITVSAYPECHPDSKSIEQEFDILKKLILVPIEQLRSFFLIHLDILNLLKWLRKKYSNTYYSRNFTDY